MPPLSPRRSSRARTTQPPPSAPSHSNSTSSISSNRAERSTRSNNKQGSPQKSATPQSLSSEEASEQLPQTRRSKRQQDHKEEVTKQEDNMEDEIIEDNEVTRCICENQDYPGLPILEEGAGELSEDAGSLFIQCDQCSVWQHGGCVGIMDDTMTPENYYCEQCRPDFHELKENSVGQKYSRYLPVVAAKSHKAWYRKSSTSKDTTGRSAKEKEKTTARPSVENLSKRRSTMNSRAAYDEDEMLRRVLEESKHEGQQAPDNGSRKGKRVRDESEDVKPAAKRQRRDTDTSSTPDSHTASQSPDPDQSKGNGIRKQMARGAAVRSQREKELREREKERAEAASKRKGRADRRRADESDTLDGRKASNGNSPQENELAGSLPPGSLPPDTPSASGSLNDTTKKGGKGGPGKRGRGRVAADTPTGPTGENGSPTHKQGKTSDSSPKDSQVNGNDVSGTENAAGHNGHGKKGRGADKDKYNSREGSRDPTMAELKRRAAAMLEYISQAEVDMARWDNNGMRMAVGAAARDTNTSDGLKKKAGELSTQLGKWQNEFGKA